MRIDIRSTSTVECKFEHSSKRSSNAISERIPWPGKVDTRLLIETLTGTLIHALICSFEQSRKCSLAKGEIDSEGKLPLFLHYPALTFAASSSSKSMLHLISVSSIAIRSELAPESILHLLSILSMEVQQQSLTANPSSDILHLFPISRLTSTASSGSELRVQATDCQKGYDRGSYR